jgi:hypothetical protein
MEKWQLADWRQAQVRQDFLNRALEALWLVLAFVSVALFFWWRLA